MLSLSAQIKQSLGHLFFPAICEGCNKPLFRQEHTLCLRCLQLLPKTNYHQLTENETSIRFAGRLPFLHATSFCYFTPDGLLQHLLHQLKYKGKREVGYFLGRQFAFDLQNVPWIKTVEAIVPVPLYKNKYRARGFNQSHLIALGMSSVLDIPVADNYLERIRNTDSQTRKTREERMENVTSAFLLTRPVAQSHLLLIDDVLTTGATLEACALALGKAAQYSFATIGIATG